MKTIRPLRGLGALVSQFVLFFATFIHASSVDFTFNPGKGPNAFVESAVIQPDGKILICGMFTEFDGQPRQYIARLNANGSLDSSFNAYPSYWVRYMVLQPDGKIVIGGFFTAVEGVNRNRVARLNSDGSLDLSFDPGTGCEGRIVPADPTDPFIFAMGLQPDGKIIIGGNFTNYNGVARSGLARLHSDGSLDPSFNVGAGMNSWVRSILMLKNGQIMVAGWFTSYNNQSFERMVRLNPNGSADRGFNARFGDRTAVYTMAEQPNGKLVVAGHSVTNTTPFYQEIVRLNVDGSYDITFNSGGVGADEKVESVVLQPDGKIIMVGYFGMYNGVERRRLARLHPNGTLDTSFNAEADNWIWTALLQSDGKLLVCGDFSSVNGVARKGIARLHTAGSFASNRLPTSPANGSLAAWFLNGADYVKTTVLKNGQGVGRNWRLGGSGDFNHDGRNDLVWQHTDGRVAVWFMDGTQLSSSALISSVPTSWRLSATGDLNGDGKTDLLWRDGRNRVVVWYMNGTEIQSKTYLRSGASIAPNWQLVGAAEFDGDGHLDLLWQHQDGRTSVWLMNNAAVVRTIPLKNGQAAAANWRVVGVGKFSLGGRNDLLWQHSDGRLAVWLMDGTSFRYGVAIRDSKPPIAGWQVCGTTDFEPDAQPELIWRYLP